MIPAAPRAGEDVRPAVGARSVRTALVAAAAFPAGYLLASGLRLPILAYEPIERRFFIAAQVTGVQMRYYGDLGWGLAAALVAAAVAFSLPSSGRPLNAGALAAVALALAGLDVAWFLSRLLAAA